MEEKREEKSEKIKQIEQIQKELRRLGLKDGLRYFDERFDFETWILSSEKEVRIPSESEIVEYCKYVTLSSKMENEVPIIALIYIERLLKKASILVTKFTWKRLLLVCMTVASKVWDDDSLENQHFPKVLAGVTSEMLNKLEQIFLGDFLEFDIVVKGSEYAKYYFIMWTLASDLRLNPQLPPKIAA